jgi:transcriptional regulator with XRE-family HTH domain
MERRLLMTTTNIANRAKKPVSPAQRSILNPGQKKRNVHECAFYEKMVHRSIRNMTEAQAVQFGKMIKARRKELKVERTVAAETTGMDVSTLYRLERGQILNPDPAKLELLAKALKLRLADVLTAAGYPATRALPEPGLYLRAKYRDLSSDELAALSEEVSAVLERYGISVTDRPSAGEDESDDPAEGPRRQR